MYAENQSNTKELINCTHLSEVVLRYVSRTVINWIIPTADLYNRTTKSSNKNTCMCNQLYNHQQHVMQCNCFSASVLTDDINRSELHQLPAALYHVQLQGSVKTSQDHVVVFSPTFHACTSYLKHTIDSIFPSYANHHSIASVFIILKFHDY